MRFETFLPLTLISFSALFVLLYRRRALDLPPPKRELLLGLRCAAFILIAVSLTGIQLDRKGGPPILFLIDLSESVGEPEESMRRVKPYFNSLPRGSTWSMIVFGSQPSVEVPLGEPLSFPETISSEVDRSGTDISSALKLAISLLPGGGRIVLFSDGNENLGDSSDLIPILRSEGIEVDCVPLSRRLKGEVMVDPSLKAPYVVRTGVPFKLRALFRSTVKTKGTVKLYRNGELVSKREIEIRPGISSIELHDQIDSEGSYDYKLVLKAAVDTLFQNNVSSAFVLVKGRPSALFVGDSNGFFVKLARLNGFEAKSIRPEDLPDDPSALAGEDVIILDGVPSRRLSKRAMEALARFVEEMGGGLLILGGPESFGAGGYFDTPIERVSPVEMDPRGKEEQLALVVLVDKSGSMADFVGTESKIELAKAALEVAINSLRDDDLFGCIAFDSKPKIVYKLGPLHDRRKVIRKTRSIKAGGGTNLYSALKLAYSWLKKADLPLKHVIAVTDGRSEGNFDPLAEKMASEGITISTIAVGDEAREILMSIAQKGKGRYYDLDDLSQLPSLFVKESHSVKKLVMEHEFTPRIVRPHPVLKGIGEVPPLKGYVATSEKEEAEVILASDLGDPILALGMSGLGRVAAFTSQVGIGWGEKWGEWKGCSRLWVQMLRWLTPHPGECRTVEVSIDRGNGRVVVEITDESGRPLSGLVIKGRVLNPDSSVQKIILQETMPGRYEGRFDLRKIGRYLVSVVREEGGKETGIGRGALFLPYPVEYAALGENERLLKRLSSLTGGVFLPEPKEISRPIKSIKPLYKPVWGWLLFLSLTLFLTEMVFRRISLGKPKKREPIKALKARPKEEQPSLSNYFEKLMKARGMG